MELARQSVDQSCEHFVQVFKLSAERAVPLYEYIHHESRTRTYTHLPNPVTIIVQQQQRQQQQQKQVCLKGMAHPAAWIQEYLLQDSPRVPKPRGVYQSSRSTSHTNRVLVVSSTVRNTAPKAPVTLQGTCIYHLCVSLVYITYMYVIFIYIYMKINK